MGPAGDRMRWVLAKRGEGHPFVIRDVLISYLSPELKDYSCLLISEVKYIYAYVCF